MFCAEEIPFLHSANRSKTNNKKESGILECLPQQEGYTVAF